MKGLLTSILTVLILYRTASPATSIYPEISGRSHHRPVTYGLSRSFFNTVWRQGIQKALERRTCVPECRIYFQWHGPRISHSRYLYRHHSFGQRHYRQTMDGCIDTAYCELRRRPRFHGQLYKRKLFAFPSPDLYDSR